MAEQKTGAGGYNVAFACSGAADVGAIADLAARQLAREKAASMCCTAAIAAGIPDQLERTALAAQRLVIDGCDKACAKAIMDQAGFTEYAYVSLGALGMEKGKTPPSEANVAKAAAAAHTALNHPASH